MADCNETLRELETFLDAELSADAKTAIRAHLAGCTDCLEAFDFHAELKALIARKCAGDPIPDDLIARISQCLDDGSLR